MKGWTRTRPRRSSTAGRPRPRAHTSTQPGGPSTQSSSSIKLSGVPPYLQKCRAFCRAAAELGRADASTLLGTWLALGYGQPGGGQPDRAGAARRWQEGRAGGDALARFCLEQGGGWLAEQTGSRPLGVVEWAQGRYSAAGWEGTAKVSLAPWHWPAAAGEQRIFLRRSQPRLFQSADLPDSREVLGV